MEDKLDYLFQQWNKHDSKVFVAENKATEHISIEELIAETTNYCRHSGRLTWVVLDWLIRNIEKIDTEKLLQLTQQKGDITILGLLSDIAKQKKDNAKFEYFVKSSHPNQQQEIFFFRVSKSKLASKITVEQSLPIYKKWNFYCNELRYLTADNELKNKEFA